MKKICILTENQNSYASQRFQKEAADAGLIAVCIRWSELRYESENGELLTRNNISFKDFDGAILRGDSTSITPLNLITGYLRQNHIPFINDVFYSKNQTVNKLRQSLLFQSKDIPSLQTIYGEQLSLSFLQKSLGLPFIAKLIRGSLGLQVFKITSKEDFSFFLSCRRTDKEPYLFQKYYPIQYDYRVMIVGNEVLGAVKRTPKNGEWRTNLHGSHHERAENMEAALLLAKSLREKTDIEYAGVDILIDDAGHARIIEINTMAQFKVFEKVFPEFNIAQKTLALLRIKMEEKK